LKIHQLRQFLVAGDFADQWRAAKSFAILNINGIGRKRRVLAVTRARGARSPAVAVFAEALVV